MLVSGLADENTATARCTLQAAGKVYLAAEDRVVSHLGFGAHQTHCGHACVDAAAQEQNRQNRLWPQSGGKAREILQFASPVLRRALLVQIVDSPLRIYRRPDGGQSVFGGG